jgi:hypothetical protein
MSVISTSEICVLFLASVSVAGYPQVTSIKNCCVEFSYTKREIRICYNRKEGEESDSDGGLTRAGLESGARQIGAWPAWPPIRT